MTRLKKHEEPDVFNRLEYYRSEKDMSRSDLAAALGVHYQTVGYLERGEYKPSLIIALKAAELFDVPVEEIFSLREFTKNDA